MWWLSEERLPARSRVRRHNGDYPTSSAAPIFFVIREAFDKDFWCKNVSLRIADIDVVDIYVLVKTGEMKMIFRHAIRFYRRFISPLLPPACRFYPTCSQYALEALERYGTVKGSWLTLKRLSKCHPYHPGGFDPLD